MSDKPSAFKKEFVSESAIRKREEEWEQVFDKVKQAKLSAAADAKVDTDPRSLFEKLQDQRLKKEEAFHEEHRLANQIHRLDDDEISFLQDWKESKAAQNAKAREEEATALADYRQQKSKIAAALLEQEEKEKEKDKEKEKERQGLDDGKLSGLKPFSTTSKPLVAVVSKQKKLLALAVKPKTTPAPTRPL